MNQFSKFLSLSLLLICLFSSLVSAQISESSEVFIRLAQNDSLLFAEGFNKCHKEKFEGLLSADLEFYHDTGGYQDREAFFEAYNNNICPDSPRKPLRELVPGTLKVFTLKQNGVLYGAIQQGKHNFYMSEKGKETYQTGTARFTHLWLLENGEWILKRVLSYDHKGPE